MAGFALPGQAPASNANLADANEGLDALGLRYGRRF
jgi:hypothetical protein